MLSIYTDGACKNNPGNGGWAFAYIEEYNNKIILQKNNDNTYINTTNNKMELNAVIYALKYLESFNIDKYDSILILTDSQYVLKGITQWIHKWKKNNWKNSKNEDVKNIDLWKELDILHLKYKNKLKWKWIPGHSNNIYNDLVDTLANNGIN